MSLESKQSKKLRIVVGAVLIIVAVFAVFFVDWGKDQKAEPPPVRPLKMIRIGQTSLPPVREYPGKMTAKDTVAIAFQVGGQIVEFPILKGQEINKGDVLAKLDDRDYKNRYNAATAEYEKTKAQLERIQKAVKSGAVSETDLTNAQADFQLAQANQDIAQKALDDTILIAPYDAVISNTFVENFEDVLAKQPVAGVQNIESIEVEAIVPQERVLKAKDQKGMFRFTTTFDSLPDREFDVQVREYTTEADPLTQTYSVTLTMPVQEQYNIFPGMTATVREYPIEEAFPDSGRFLVPIDATPVDGQGHYYVWKVKEQDGKLSVHRQEVSVGNAMGDEIEILKGLNKGDRIAAQGVNLLQEGQQVREYKLKGEKQK
jgi:multidrug efflux system membrane fusion protein